MSATRDLARFVAGTGYADLPPDVRHATRRCLVNATGVALHAAGDSALEILLGAFRGEGGAARATVWGTGTRSPLLLAALANGFLIHLDDFDDTHFPTVVHPSAPVIPVALALGQAHSLPSRDVLTAVALGVEVCCRVALGVHPWHYDAGWHITGTAGVFGAAAAAGKLLGLDAGAIAAAFGAAGTQAAGVREVFGTMTKALHAGRAAQSGLLAALLAQRGFTAPETILEGRRGFGAVLSGRHDFARATAGLGQTWEIHRNGFKPYACGVVIHPLIDACLALRQQPGVRPEDVVAVEARVHPLVLELVDRPTIQSGLEGKFSVQHGIAVALVDGAAGPAQFEDRKARDPLLTALRSTVTLLQDDTLSEDAAALRLTLRHGRSVEHTVAHATGSPAHPMTDAQLSDKFRALAGPRRGEAGADALLSALWRFDDLVSLPDL
jgi:2-methylcitrate dehydratase PrpD